MPKRARVNPDQNEYLQFIDGEGGYLTAIPSRFQYSHTGFMDIVGVNFFTPGFDTLNDRATGYKDFEDIIACHKAAESVLTEFPHATRIEQYNMIVDSLGKRLDKRKRLMALAYISENKNRASILDIDAYIAEKYIDAALDLINTIDKINHTMLFYPWWECIANLIVSESITIDPNFREVLENSQTASEKFREMRDQFPGYGVNELDPDSERRIGDMILNILCTKLILAEK